MISRQQMTQSGALRLCVLGLFALSSPPALADAAAPVALQLTGRGVQIYVCKTEGPIFTWTLAGPEADLTDPAGRIVAHHFAGPSWRARDGSTIVGEALSASASPTPGAVPWMVLRVKSRVGPGSFAEVAYITRTQTEGGAAPVSGCDVGHVNQEVRTPYAAVYTFFPQKAAADP